MQTKIILVIGGSCSGKTTFVKKRFIDGPVENFSPKGGCRYSICGKRLFIGNYNIGKACEGADTIGFTQDPMAAELIKNNIGKFEEIIAEGERVTKSGFWQKIKDLSCQVDVYYFKVSFEEAKKRKEASRLGQLWRGKTSFSEGFLKMTITKAENFAKKSKEFGFNLIEASSCAE